MNPDYSWWNVSGSVRGDHILNWVINYHWWPISGGDRHSMEMLIATQSQSFREISWKGSSLWDKNIHQLIRFLLDWSILKSLTLSRTCIQCKREELREVIWSNLLFDVSSQMLEDGPSVPSVASHHNTPQSQSDLSWQLRIVDSALFKTITILQ